MEQPRQPSSPRARTLLSPLATPSLSASTTQVRSASRATSLPAGRARLIMALPGPTAASCRPTRMATRAIPFWRATIPLAASTLRRCSSRARVLTFLSPPITAPHGLHQSKVRRVKRAVISRRIKNGSRSITSVEAAMANVYLVERDFGPGNGIYFFRSTDNGATFAPSGGTLIVSGMQGAFVTVSPDHSVHAYWYDGASIKVRKSTDQGVTFASAVTVASGLVGGTNGDLGLTGLRQGTATFAPFRSNEFPHAAVNPISGNVYVTYDNDGPGSDKADVFFVQSTDGGATWSAPIRVN